MIDRIVQQYSSTPSSLRKTALAVIHKDLSWLEKISKLYKDMNISMKTYTSDSLERFKEDAMYFDVVLIGEEEEETTGQDTIKSILSKQYRGMAYLITDIDTETKYSIKKESLLEDPCQILSTTMNLEKLRSLTERLPKIDTMSTELEGNTKRLMEGWALPWVALLNQPSCGIVHAHHTKGDTQKGYHVESKVAIVLIRGHIEFDTSQDGFLTHYSLMPGDVAVIPPGSNHHTMTWLENGESLFISLPCWEGTPKVK